MLQAIVENLLKEYENVLVLRVRMPIIPDLCYPRNFITKIIKYDKVCDGRSWLQSHTLHPCTQVTGLRESCPSSLHKYCWLK